MRYPDGGGLAPAARARREQVRLEAAGLFAAGVRPSQVARQLRVSRKSAYAWHKAWSLAGTEALLSKGPGGQSCRLSDGQMQRLEAALDAGPAAYGWSEDQRWTLARVALLVGGCSTCPARYEGSPICCIDSAGARRCRIGTRLNAMKRRSPPG